MLFRSPGSLAVAIRADAAGRGLLARADCRTSPTRVSSRHAETALGQLRPHVLPQPGIQEFTWSPRLTCVGDGPRLCRAGGLGSLAWCCGSTRGSRCWGLVLIPSPSSATIGPGSGPDSESHGLRHSCVDRVSLTRQHLSPSGLVVLHLELELKLLLLVPKEDHQGK